MKRHFIPRERMGQARLEEAILRRILKKEAPGKKLVIIHENCGALYPYLDALPNVKKTFNEKTFKWEDAQEVTPEKAVAILKRRKKRKPKAMTIAEFNKQRYGK
jgi:hypothetical protein